MSPAKHRTAAVLAREIPTATPEIEDDGIPWCNRKCKHVIEQKGTTPAHCELAGSFLTAVCVAGVKSMASELPSPPRHTCSRCDKDAFNERHPGLPPEGITIKLFANDNELLVEGSRINVRAWPMLCTSCTDAIRAIMVHHPDGIPF